MNFDRPARSVAIGLLACLLLPITTTFRAGAQAPDAGGETVCSLDPGIAGLLERCAAGDETGSACALARVARALVAADEGAATEILQREMGFDSAGASDLLSTFRLLALFAIGSFEPMSPCAAQASLSLMRAVEEGMAGLPMDAWLVLWPILEWEDDLLPAVESRVDPARIEPLRRTRAGIETYFEASGNSQALEGTDQLQILWKVIVGGEPDLGSPSDSRPPSVDAAQTLREGVAALAAGQLEDAVRWLQQAEQELETMDGDDLRTRSHLRFARWLRILTFEEMGEREHAERLRAEIGVTDHPLEQALDDIVRAMQGDDTAMIDEILSRLIAYAWEGPDEAAELGAFFNAMAEVIPGMPGLTLPDQMPPSPSPPKTRPKGSTGSPGTLTFGGDFPRRTAEVAAEVFKGHYDVAAQKALELLDLYPRYTNLGLFFHVVRQQLLSGDRDGALANGLKGLDRLEELVATMEVEELRRSFIDEKGHLLYRIIFGLAAEMGKIELAFEVAERGRAWDVRGRWGALLSPPPIPGAPGPGALEPTKRETEALGKLVAHEAGGEPSDAAQREAWLARRSELRDDFRHQRLERNLVRILGGGRQTIEVPSPPPLSTVRDQLPDGWSLVVYASYADTLWAFVVQREQETGLHELPLTPTELETLVGTAEGSTPTDPRPASPSRGVERFDAGRAWQTQRHGELYEKLIGPFRGELDGERILIVPFGPMARIPFAALWDGDSYLIEDFELAQIPSVTALSLWQQRAGLSPGAEVGVWGPPGDLDPPLGGALREARQVARFFGGRAAGPFEKEDDLYASAPRLGLLHLATHGEFPPENPLFSRLHLAASDREDGFLDFHEIWDRLALRHAQLVILSGCETGLGESTRGDDVLGMTSAFLAAGSRSVISTLWRVPDQPSAELMVTFYEHWLSGRTVASALRQAQLGLLRSKGAGHQIGSWAGYVLTGDPTTRWKPAGDNVENSRSR